MICIVWRPTVFEKNLGCDWIIEGQTMDGYLETYLEVCNWNWDWDTMSRTVRVTPLDILPSNRNQVIRQKPLAFNRNVVSNSAPLLTGWVVLTFSWGWGATMWEHGRGGLSCQNTGYLLGGLATTGKRLVVWKRCDIWTALRVHSLGKSDNSSPLSHSRHSCFFFLSKCTVLALWLNHCRSQCNVFFFELCCARHYNCGSHWAVLKLSLLDNEVKRKGQEPKTQSKPKQNPKTTTTLSNRNVSDQSSKGETRWNKLRLSRQSQSPALTTSSARNSQRPMQCVVTESRYRLRLAPSSFSSS